MKVLIACEFSGIVRNAFIAEGHNATSCDLLPTELPGPHIQGDITQILSQNWDLMIAHPPCTHLASSGARWFPLKQLEQKAAIEFFLLLVNAPIPKIAIENPIGIMSSKHKKPSQYIQPWEYGHGETKRTCLWLKNLPKLQPTNIVSGRDPKIHYMSPGPDRAKNRSRTYIGWAKAMAAQWGASENYQDKIIKVNISSFIKK